MATIIIFLIKTLQVQTPLDRVCSVYILTKSMFFFSKDYEKYMHIWQINTTNITLKQPCYYK